MRFNRISRNKKGVELSMNTVIIAAIALIVLIVLVIILTGNAGKLSFGLKDCTTKGGEAAAGVPECTAAGGVVIDTAYYKKGDDGKLTKIDNQVCCSIK